MTKSGDSPASVLPASLVHCKLLVNKALIDIQILFLILVVKAISMSVFHLRVTSKVASSVCKVLIPSHVAVQRCVLYTGLYRVKSHIR